MLGFVSVSGSAACSVDSAPLLIISITSSNAASTVDCDGECVVASEDLLFAKLIPATVCVF